MLYSNLLGTLLPLRWVIAPLYLLLAAGVIYLVLPGLGTELFPAADAGQFKLRLRARTGTRIERTEEYALQALQLMQREVPVAISSAFIGVQPASYPINTIFLWTSGPHEAVFQVALKPEATLRGEALRERLRAVFAKELPQVQVSFEAGDIVSDVLSFGSPTPVEVAIQGPALPANRAHAEKVMAELRKLPALRDLQFAQPLDYPTVDVQIDRERAGQYGLTMANVARSLVAATSSSRFVDPNYWRDPNSGNAFQIQVEIPQHRMASVNDLADLPVMQNREARPTLGDVATIKPGKTYGLVERYNMQRVVSITANLHNIPLGEAEAQIRAAIRRAGEPARGVTVQVRGQVPALNSTLDGLRLGLAVAIAAILLLLTAYFQSLRLALVVLSTVPAVLAGVVLALRFTGTTLNLQSFMGAIMATGIAIANSILLVTFAELARRSGGTLAVAAAARLRAVLMTAFAMMAGMTPMALGTAQTAPLGRAVLGGLALATVATLTVVPLFYNILQPQNARDASLLPHEENS
jgi:multidrug efflux pump subunit AcrB